MPASAVDVVSSAYRHTVQQLFKPFRLGQWMRLAFTGLLAGEMSGAGGCSFQIPWRPQSPNDRTGQFLAQAVPPGALLVLIPLLVVLALALFILLLYISSRMRFVLFDSVVTKECRIRRFWANRGEPSFRYFLFQALVMLAALSGMALIAGTAFAIAFAFGWLRNPRLHLVPLILSGIVAVVILFAFVFVIAVIVILAKDFVVPQMALENVSVGEGWRRLSLMVSAEKAGYAGYIGMKIVLSIAGAIVMSIAALILILVLGIPMALVAIIAVFAAKAIGIGWNVFTLAVAITAGCIAAAIIVFGILLLAVPLVVFFPAYSIYFLAARYPALNEALTTANGGSLGVF